MTTSLLDYKQCSRCLLTKSLDDFYRHKGGVSGRHSYCKKCYLAWQTDKYVGVLKKSKTWIEKQKRRQGNKCMLCKKDFDQTADVDHCHVTGKYRSILCRKCNGGLGQFNDDPELLRRAANYIEFYRRKHS